MSIKADRPQVRTAEQLERKYNFATMEKAIKQSDVGLIKVSNELYEFVKAVAGDTETLEKQLDGEIDTWYGDESPTLENLPASEWDEDELADHIEDIYYDRSTGRTYKFTESDGTYSWEETSKNFLAEILALSNSAQDTADGKKVVFTSQPTPPYDNGDIWLRDGKLYVCQVARSDEDNFNEEDWIIGTDYIDGTQATAIGNSLLEVYNGVVTRMIATSEDTTWDRVTSITNVQGQQLDEIHEYIKFAGASILLGKDNSLYKLKIENDRIAIYYNDAILSAWVQDKYSVGQINIGKKEQQYHFSFIPRNNGSLSFRKVKSDIYVGGGNQ